MCIKLNKTINIDVYVCKSLRRALGLPKNTIEKLNPIAYFTFKEEH